MSIRIKNVLMTALLSFSAGHAVVSQAQQAGPPPSPPADGMQAPNSPMSSFPGAGAPSGPGGAGRDAGAPDRFSAGGGRDFGRTPGDQSSGRNLPGAPPEMPKRVAPTRAIPLNDVVSKVQERFNATAVKTDSVVGMDGSVSYRIRLLSADKSRVWTVNVDASTGQLK